MPKLILIVAEHQDLHALVIQKAIRDSGRCQCEVVTSDTIAERETITLRLGLAKPSAVFRNASGALISVGDARVVWLRRPESRQETLNKYNKEANKLVEKHSHVGLRSLLTSGFHGKWISTFDATIRASDKLLQLKAANACGFRIPETLVSQSRSQVVDFHESCAHGIIVKGIAGTGDKLLFTRAINDPFEFDEAAYSAVPAIYQEYVPGCRHIRLVLFGDTSIAASIDSQELDWRTNLQVPITHWPVPPWLHAKARDVLTRLGLEMGIIDLKETSDGEIVWLEVNPQGQFLFLEPLARLNLASRFSEYLIAEAKTP